MTGSHVNRTRMNGARILVGAGAGTLVVWVVATVDPYVALVSGAVGAGAVVGVHRASSSPDAVDGEGAGSAEAVDGTSSEDDADSRGVDATDSEDPAATDSEDGAATDSEDDVGDTDTEPGDFDFEGAVAAVGTLLVVLGGSLLSGTIAGQTGSAIVDALVVLGVFGYSLFGLLVPGFSLAGLGGAAVSRRLARRVDG